MYRIGQFSRFTRLTVKALRFYEEEGLLEPELTDPVNGYRYYSNAQLPRAHRIAALKQCGFSIPEIRSILAGRDVGSLFAERRRELERRAVETAAQLASINHYLENIGKEDSLRYEVVLKELPACLTYGKRMVVESYDSYFTLIPKIGEETMAVNPSLRCAADPPYCFIMYHDGEYRDRDIDVEFREAVADRGNGRTPEGIDFKLIDRVPTAACVLHQGSYADLPYAYKAVFDWIEDNGWIPAGSPRESYLDGIWNKRSEADWLTELQVPVSAG